MKIILAGYCLIILIGTLLLSLPISLRSGTGVDVSKSFFTATSATCVTGLVCTDTYTHWSSFGQAIILCMIQIGGIGFMTFCITAMSLTKAKISLNSRSLMQNSISAPQVGGIVRVTKFIILGSALIEFIGAFLLSFFFIPRAGLARGLWFSVFHSISAFCNAGFDLMSYFRGESFTSFTAQTSNIYVNVILMTLIVIGGLGFFVWRDLLDNKFKFSKLNLQSKIVLTTTLILIFGGAFLIYLLEYSGEEMQSMGIAGRITGAFFQSVTSRTAGFNTMQVSTLSGETRLIMMVLMLIGGSAGSTAGGIKTTTFAVLFFTVTSTFHQRKNVEAFGRRLEDGISKTACCILALYFSLSLSFGMIIARLEHISLESTIFECISAIATVGITEGITPALGIASRTLLIILMLFGRVGSLTMLLAFSSKKNANAVSALPLEKIQLG